MAATNSTILALDVGERRIGVAATNLLVRLPKPLTTLTHTDAIWHDLDQLIQTEAAACIVVGLPRGLDGQETAQTATVRDFVTELQSHVTLPVFFQDEALTSQKAEAELKQTTKNFDKGMIDALAATYILEDFLRDNPELQL
jgi:putative Holliday junction resolvase